MYIFHGLFVASFVFEAFVIQSDAVGDNSKEAPKDEVILPYEVIGNILYKAGLKATKGAGQSRALIAGSRDAMSRIFEDRILVIHFSATINRTVETHERLIDGQIHFYFGNYDQLLSYFQTYGKHARRILINYHFMDETIRRDINKNIISEYAKYFTELRFSVGNDSGFWEEISNKNGKIQFPNVKKFTYMCLTPDSGIKLFDLNAIFPKLESVKLVGSISDPNCLANLTKLKELTVLFSTIPERHFRDIFAKNKQISMLTISPQEPETLRFIEKYLKNLQTFNVEYGEDEFVIGGNRVYSLPSVTSFIFKILGENQLKPGGLSFKMPNLKRLKVHGESILLIDQKLSDFIKSFENLDTVEIATCDDMYDAIKCIEKLATVKEFISPFPCHLLPSLENFFKTFDRKKSKLDSLKLICIGNEEHENAEEFMNKINVHLIKSNKPTWTLTTAVENERNMNYLLIKRNL